MLVIGNILIGAFHLTPRDTAWFWLFTPALAVALSGGLASFFGMVVFLV